MLNWIWLGLILGGVVYAGFAGTMGDVSRAIFDSGKSAVHILIDLAGPMIFFLGLMRVASDGGLISSLTRVLRPLMRRLFPDLPPDHPAMGAMILNFASNILGMGNAATPFGLKAMKELGRSNPHPGVATESMILFLAINTSQITLMAPTGTMAIRSAAGSEAPAAIWIPTLIATTCSTLAAVGAFYLMKRMSAARVPTQQAAAPIAIAEPEEELPLEAPPSPTGSTPGWSLLLVAGVVVLLALGLVVDAQRLVGEVSGIELVQRLSADWPFPLLVVALLLVGMAGRVRVYEATVAGAREGLEVVIRILPYLVVVLVAVGVFRASGALDLLIRFLEPFTSAIGVPAEVMPMALMRPLSGQGALGVMAETLETYGPDTFIGYLTSTLQGSTDTTFYVLAIYSGAAGVRNLRYALPACLIGDVGGFLGATAACHLFFG